MVDEVLRGTHRTASLKGDSLCAETQSLVRHQRIKIQGQPRQIKQLLRSYHKIHPPNL